MNVDAVVFSWCCFYSFRCLIYRLLIHRSRKQKRKGKEGTTSVKSGQWNSTFFVRLQAGYSVIFEGIAIFI